MPNENIPAGVLAGTTPMFARQPFRFAGKDYQPGDRFNWKRLCVNKRQMIRLYHAGRILPDLDVDEMKPKRVRAEKKEEKKPKEEKGFFKRKRTRS